MEVFETALLKLAKNSPKRRPSVNGKRGMSNGKFLGQKATNLQWLMFHTEQIPESWVIPTSVYSNYLRESANIPNKIKAAIESSLPPDKIYAVRSSSTVEDQMKRSYAGQFTSHTNVSGINQITEAILNVFDTAQSDSVRSYQEQLDHANQPFTMAVLIQEMIEPVVSGVSVSRNPLTGLNEIVVEAVAGSGEALVQDGIKPDHWVHKWGRFTHRPKDPLLSDKQVEHIVKETKRLGDAFGEPVDLEWVYDGRKVYWLQIRPLTGLDTINIYSNTISRELLPGLIKPLVWSVNIPLVNTAWINLFEELVGPSNLKPEELAKSFYYHAYFNMGIVGQIFELLGFPRDSLELLMGFEKAEGMPTYKPSLKTLRFLPRVIWFLLRIPGYLKRFERDLANANKAYRDFLQIDIKDMEEKALLETYEWLYDVNLKLAYHNILVPLSMGVYNGLLGRQLRKHQIDPLDVDLDYDLNELEDFDPKIGLNNLHQIYSGLPDEAKHDLDMHGFDVDHPPPSLDHFLNEVKSFLDRFGHFSESGNDFSIKPWRDDPRHILSMIRRHAWQVRSKRVNVQEIKLDPLSTLLVKLWSKRTSRYMLERERVSSTYTFGYGLFRNLFLALGERMVERSMLLEHDDIFLLSLDEVLDIVESDVSGSDIQQKIAERKDELELASGIILPDVFYGDETPPIEAFAIDFSSLHGMPTSRGYYEGKVTVIESLAEAEKLDKGDVLVVPFSDVAWTPLFGLAGAVIAESGGVLSHSSIVAREMGIPCVVSVANACQLEDGTRVIVDGHRGEITIKE